MLWGWGFWDSPGIHIMVPVGLAAKCLPSLRLGLCCLPLSPRRMEKKDTCNYVVPTLKVQGGCKTIVTQEKSLMLYKVTYSWTLGSVGWWPLGFLLPCFLQAAGCSPSDHLCFFLESLKKNVLGLPFVEKFLSIKKITSLLYCNLNISAFRVHLCI